jgi:maltose alpha-D-glucosyltransferase / alpha-amylase
MSDADGLWYKDAIVYELHVRSFHDSSGAGMGDFRGLTQKLDYLQDLGVTAIWLLPFYPSPLKDDGYDIADYTGVNEQYGRLDDFRAFLHAAHRRHMRVITELVINHTSDQHPWFQRARRSPPGSVERDFYVWSDTAEKYLEAGVVFKDYESSNWTWDPVAKAYYWHRFYSHQPDLNFDNPAVWDALIPVVDFWLDMGIDGMRLDAVAFLYEREGTTCENLPETHAFLKALRAHVDANFPNRMFLAEVDQWPEDAVAYFGDGDECQMAFHFPLMPRLFMALHQEDRFPIIDILGLTPSIPENCQWCLFLRNHDELTLAMVTDEERDYMYNAYAMDPTARFNLGIRRRLAPLLSNDRRRIELMNALLLSLPGTPVIYYGDEIGMGDNVYLGDRNGVRTPMQWSSDRNAGFSRANPQKLFLPVIIDPEYHFEAVNVEAQQSNSSSLLWWMKRLIALRKQYKAFGRGSIEFIKSDNPKILAFVRRYQDERILVVANLSRFVQCAELDLHEFRGFVPHELFGQSLFPPIGETTYRLTMGMHGFCWFALVAPLPGEHGSAIPAEPSEPIVLEVPARWDQWLFQEEPDRLEALLPAFLGRRQLAGRGQISATQIQRAFTVRQGDSIVHWLLIKVEYINRDAESILLPTVLVPEKTEAALLEPVTACGLVRLTGARSGVLCDALAEPSCDLSMLTMISGGKTTRLAEGELAATWHGPLIDDAAVDVAGIPVTLLRSRRFNSTIAFGSRYLLKVYRRIDEGVNPGVEVGGFLARRACFEHMAPLLGSLEYRRRNTPPVTVAVLHKYVENQGAAWQLTLDQLSLFFERVAAHCPPPSTDAHAADGRPTADADLCADPRAVVDGLIGGYLHNAHLLGDRTGEMHAALASDATASAFAPEPFGAAFQRSTYQSLRNLANQICTRLTRQRSQLSAESLTWADALLARSDLLLDRLRAIAAHPIGGRRIRCHGDYHLGQLLYTGSDFVVIDFEGDPEETFGKRRLKQSPLRDVAALLRSVDQAMRAVLHGLADVRGHAPGVVRAEDLTTLEPWGELWRDRVTSEFLAAYYARVEPLALLPASPSERDELLDLFLLGSALEETGQALAHDPAALFAPLKAVVRMLGGGDEPNRAPVD